jgi:hypothetical protein
LQTTDPLVQKPGPDPRADAERGEASTRRADETPAATRRAADVQTWLADPAPGEAGLDGIAAALARELAARGEARPFILTHPGLSGGANARPVPAPRGSRERPLPGRGGTRGGAWVVITTDDGPLDEPVRLVGRAGRGGRLLAGTSGSSRCCSRSLTRTSCASTAIACSGRCC